MPPNYVGWYLDNTLTLHEDHRSELLEEITIFFFFLIVMKYYRKESAKYVHLFSQYFKNISTASDREKSYIILWQ